MKTALIEWNDIAFVGFHWENREPFLETSKPCVTAGIILHEDKDNIQVVSTLTSDLYCQGLVIPKGCIKRLRYLEVKDE